MSLFVPSPPGIAWAGGGQPLARCYPQSGVMLPPAYAAGIQFAQVFDNHMAAGQPASAIPGTRAICWGNSAPIPGVYTTCYTPYSRANLSSTSLAWFKANNPDWLVYQNDQATLYQEWPYDYGQVTPNYYFVDLDIQNPGVRAYKLSYCVAQAAAGFTGMAFDNVSLTNIGTTPTGTDNIAGHFVGSAYDANGNRTAGTWMQDYWGIEYGDVPFMQAQIAYMVWMRQQMNAASVPLMANIQNPSAASESMQCTIRQLLYGCDIWLSEGCFQNTAQRTPLDADWLAYYQVASGFAQNGGVWLACAYCSNNNPALLTQNEIAWITGNFLLMRGSQSYLSPGAPGYYVAWPASFTPAIGSPLGAAVQIGATVWQRQFTNGFVVVNSSSTQAGTFTVPSGTWTDQFGNPIAAGATSLAAQSAIVVVA